MIVRAAFLLDRRFPNDTGQDIAKLAGLGAEFIGIALDELGQTAGFADFLQQPLHTVGNVLADIGRMANGRGDFLGRRHLLIDAGGIGTSASFSSKTVSVVTS